MEAKKVNIFAFLTMIVMCVVTIFVSVGKKDNTSNNSDEILSLYKKIDNLERALDDVDDQFELVDTKIEESKGDSAYDVAKSQGFTGNVNEWLDSLKGRDGEDGEDAELDIPLDQIYTAYLTSTGKTSTEYTYDDFLLEIASGKYSTSIATQKAYSTTVDIFYSYSSQIHYIQSSGTSFSPIETKTSGGVSAGAGVIYQMFDSDLSDDNDELDTAYIITNYHVAYIDNYSNDPNYVVYGDCTITGLNYSTLKYSYTVNEYFLANDYTTSETNAVTKLSIDEAISKHFLIGGETGDYYGIYLYGRQTKDYKLNATFVGGSADNDIAILKIDRNDLSSELAEIFFDSGDYEPAKLGDSISLKGGEEVIAVGNPLLPNTNTEQEWIDSLVLSITDGVVSSVSEDIKMKSLIGTGEYVSMRLIRVSAAINGGNSGGGLYDLYGNLVGIVNAKISDEEYDNVGFAIPINIAAGIADQIIYQCDGTAKTSTNTRIKTLKVENLGFSIKNGMSNSSTSLDLNGNKIWTVTYNVVVGTVTEDSLAYGGGNGLVEGDIIKQVSFGGVSYSANEFFSMDYELNDLLLKVKLDCVQISFTVSRDGHEQTITMSLTESCFKEIA